MTSAPLKRLMNLAAADPASWWDRVDASAEGLATELADEALAEFHDSMRAGDPERAQLAAMVRREAALALGRR